MGFMQLAGEDLMLLGLQGVVGLVGPDWLWLVLGSF